MKKHIIIPLALFSSLLGLGFLLHGLIKKIHDKSESCVVDIYYDSYGRIMIPMTVDNHTEYFQWDSRASASVIANKADIYSEDSMSVSILEEKQVRKLAVSNSAIVRLGGFDFSKQFILYEKHVIGADIFNNYYWCFNLVDNKCEISKTPIKISETDSMIKLILYFEKHAGTPVCNLKFNNAVSARFAFDTGHSGCVFSSIDTTGGREKIIASLNYDMIIASRDSTSKGMTFFNDMLKSSNVQGIKSHDKKMYGIILNSAKLNNIYMTMFLQYEEDLFYGNFEKDNIIGIITNSFIRRFDIMYYSPFENIIELYCSRDKIPQLLGAEIYKYLEYQTGAEYPYKVKNPYNTRPQNS